jgi:hypothetical protein
MTAGQVTPQQALRDRRVIDLVTGREFFVPRFEQRRRRKRQARAD